MRLLPSIFALAMGLLAGLVYTYSMQARASRCSTYLCLLLAKVMSKCIYLHAPRAADQGPLQVRLRPVADHESDTSYTASLQESFLSATAPPHSTELRLGAAAAAAPAVRLRVRVAGSASHASSQVSGAHNVSAHQGGMRAGGAQRADPVQLPLQPQPGQPDGPVKGAGSPRVCAGAASWCAPACVYAQVPC